jgi:hypothetical protein
VKNVPSVRRTSLEDFVRDLISMIEEQIVLAKADPALHQKRVVAVCGDAVSILRLRLEENEAIGWKCAISTGLFNAHWRTEWDALAKASSDEFAIKADMFLANTRQINFILTHSETSPPITEALPAN